MQAHSNYNIISVIVSVFFAKILNKKIIVMYYGGAAKEFFKSYPKLIKFTFSYVDETIVAGNYVQSAFDQLNIKILSEIKDIVKKHQGYTTLIKVEEDLKASADIFTIDPIKYKISEKIKRSFDPKRIFNPGKMYTGI